MANLAISQINTNLNTIKVMKFISFLSFILIAFSACQQQSQITNAELAGLYGITPDSMSMISDDYSIVREGQKIEVPADNLPVMVYGEPKNVIDVVAHSYFQNKAYVDVYNIVDISLLEGSTSVFYRDQLLYEFEEIYLDDKHKMPIRFLLHESVIDEQSFLFVKGDDFFRNDVGALYVDGALVSYGVKKDSYIYTPAAIKKVPDMILVRFENGEKNIFGYFDQKSKKIIFPTD